jgi:hypothetical protein
MSKLGFHLLYSMFLVFCLPAYEMRAQDTIPIPVKKVELYKNGMGYFEHLGTVKGQQNVEIVLPSSQLNDVLKSLTILDLGHGQIGGVTYDSTAPLSRRLAELPIDLSSAKNLVDFLNQIQGAGLEIRTPSGLIAGKLMGAEIKTKSTGPGATVQEIQLNVLTNSGEVRIVELESAGALKLTDQTLAQDLGRYLDLLDTTHQRNVRRLRIQTLGTGERQLFVGYTSEAPIWKTTYRIVLDPKQKPLLQGWAIVDNTTPMDWLNVSLSLVAGAPISFIQDLSQPIYARRPVVPLPQGVEVNPQVYESTVEDEMAESPAGIAEGQSIAGAMGGFGGGRMDMERKAGAMRMEAAPPPPRAMNKAFAAPSAPSADISSVIRQQATATAQAQAVAEQFEYKIRQPVTIRRNESALLPILQSDVDGEKVSVYKATDNEQHPRLAFWLKNSSGATLDAGPVTIIDTNAFAGEGLIETVQPGENRLLSYAIDLGTVVSTVSGSERRRVERVVINQGMMRLIAKMADKKSYKIRNNNDAARTVIIEHPVRSGWKLIGTTPTESSVNYYRFKVEAKAKSTVDYVVQEESPIESSFSVSSITPEQIAVWIQDRSIDPEIEKSLRAIADKKIEINDLAQKIAALDKEQNEIFRDQERVRGNLQRLGQTPEEATLRQRYIRQLDSQENRLATIKAEREKLDTSRSTAQKQLDDLIQKLSLDKKI